MRAVTNWLRVTSSWLSTPCWKRCWADKLSLSGSTLRFVESRDLTRKLSQLRIGQRRIQNHGIAFVLNVQRGRMPINFCRLDELTQRQIEQCLGGVEVHHEGAEPLQRQRKSVRVAEYPEPMVIWGI